MTAKNSKSKSRITKARDVAKKYVRAEYVNALVGPRPVAITLGTDGMYYCENRSGKVLAGPYSTEKEATHRAYHLVEHGRHADARLTKREIDANFKRAWARRSER